MHIEVTRYRKPDGFVTRYWSVMVNGELLVVTLYRKGAEAVAQIIANPIMPTEPEASPPATGDHAPCVTAGDSMGQASEVMRPFPEPEAARRKRRRKGLLRKILGDCPF